MGHKRDKKGEQIYMKKGTEKDPEKEIVTEPEATTMDQLPAEEEKEAVTEEKKEPEQLVYVGPTIVGVAVQYTVYKNGIPNSLSKAIAEVPAIGCLVLPVSQLAEAMKKITKKQGALYTQYQNALLYKTKKGE